MTTATLELSPEARLTLALDRLPIGDRDRRYLVEAFDLLSDQHVTEYDMAEAMDGAYGRKVWRAWEVCLSIPVILYPTNRTAKRLDECAWFDPLPSRGELLVALEEAADEWAEVLA